MREAALVVCRCGRSVAAVSAIFACLAVLLVAAQRKCSDAGGALSDAAWTCDGAAGAASLWSLVTPAMGVMGIAMGAAVYVAVERGMRRLVTWLQR